MKTKYLLFILCIVYSGWASAQRHSLFDKYADQDDVTVINISKAMFKMMGGSFKKSSNAKIDKVDITGIVDKIDNLTILTSDKSGLKEKMYADFSAMIAKDRNYEELMRIKDGKSRVTFNIKKRGTLINELIMLVNDENDFVIIQIAGSFTLKDVQNITSHVQ